MSASNLEFLVVLEEIIQDRRDSPAAGSYTSELLNAGRKRMAQKVGEEGVELALAALEQDRDEIVNEAADLLYHMLVMLAAEDMRVTDVVAVLERRHDS